MTDARSNTTSYEYDKAGRVTKVTDAPTNITKFAYDVFGRATDELFGACGYCLYTHSLAK